MTKILKRKKQKVEIKKPKKKNSYKKKSSIHKVAENESEYLIEEKSKLLDINFEKTCSCKGNNINCLTAKEWLKNQLGVWEFFYGKRDVRNKELHPATFPLSMARKVIELFSHQGELVLDPFVGSGTSLVAAQDTNRNAVGFDLQQKYVDLCKQRLSNEQIFNNSKQLAIV